MRRELIFKRRLHAHVNMKEQSVYTEVLSAKLWLFLTVMVIRMIRAFSSIGLLRLFVV